ncbi:UDP-xylose and UDP-N-acetylglucosamine transporter-like [Ornithodoros turicata]|uniref:UDP-xylose and UDP-N-acetylglucosamine transporter-like n=1 Tax=Ornithodoros turicata TaxID=34597 RepID=UPI0031394C39
MSRRVVVATLLVFVGCCTNVILLELLVKEQPGCTSLITFVQFLFIAVEGFAFAARFGKQKPVVPLRHYIALVVMHFLVSVTNNKALSYDISMPLHMIFKSGSLIATMLLGIMLLGRRYPVSKYIAVFMITAGIIVCTYASVKGDHKQKEQVEPENGTFYNKLIGVSLLSFALLLSARLGIYQENLSTRFGKHPRESLFYAHALPLPGFLLLLPDILHQAALFAHSAPLEIGLLSAVPRAWVYLFLNVITQYICIRSVYVLTTECSSLTVTLIITLRKFISLLLSIFYFQNPFTAVHWAGTILVFAGTLLFAQVFGSLTAFLRSKAVKVE